MSRHLFVTFLMTALIAVMGVIGCERIPLGVSSMTATIGGVRDTFRTIRAESYFGMRVGASSKTNRLHMVLADAAVGSYEWRSASGHQFSADTVASLNGFDALPGSGGFTITEHDYEDRRLVGTFFFSVYDTLKKDTISLTRGRFTLYYIAGE